MNKSVFTLLILALQLPVAHAICDLPPPIVKIEIAPTPGDPAPPITPDAGPTGPTTPREGARPTTPGANPRGGATRSRPSAPNYAGSWEIWWELNREHLLGLRQTLKRNEAVTGERAGPELMAAHRARVRVALRKIASGTADDRLRAAALCALGRAGEDADARLFLGILRARGQRAVVREAAAMGLGCLPRIDDSAVRNEVRAFFRGLLEGRGPLTGRTRMLAIMATSLRGREDSVITMTLAARCNKGFKSANEAAAILYACGLAGDRELVPAVTTAARTGKLGKRRLHDAARSHAVLALGMIGEPSAVKTLDEILRSRSAQVHTRRSAALAFGLLLRSDRLDADQVLKARRALMRAFDKERDPLVQGFCAVSMGNAREPFGMDVLQSAVDRSGNAVVRPYAALALGLAARRLDGKKARKVRNFLLREFPKARDVELAGALSIALGLSRAKEAKERLFERLEWKRLKAAVRAPAIQGLGLLGETSPRIERTLIEALEDGTHRVEEDAALALGMLGRRSAARILVDKLVRTRSEPVQAHMVAALSHLGGTAAIEPLLAVLADASNKHTIRASAASALGILVDDRACDPLFQIDASTNPYALTTASRELVLVY